jgi:hypothetical protein
MRGIDNMPNVSSVIVVVVVTDAVAVGGGPAPTGVSRFKLYVR